MGFFYECKFLTIEKTNKKFFFHYIYHLNLISVSWYIQGAGDT